jgi:DNA-directed RNA polymerase beta' subunit
MDIIDPTDIKRKISGIKFGFYTDDEIKKSAVFKVLNNTSLLKDGVPDENSIISHKLGIYNTDSKCLTCNRIKQECEGHKAYIQLKYPVKIPALYTQINMYINITCLNCYKFTNSNQVQYKSLVTLYNNIKNKKDRKCGHCGAIMPKIIRKSKKNIAKYVLEFNEKSKDIDVYRKWKLYLKKDSTKLILFNHIMYDIFGNISKESLHEIKGNNEVEPINLLSYYIIVPPNQIKPDSFIEVKNSERKNPINNQLEIIYGINANIPNNYKDLNLSLRENEILRKSLLDLDLSYYDILIGLSKKSKKEGQDIIKSINNKWKSKTGRFRQDLNGKRVENVFSGVISPNPFLEINEAGIPQDMLQKLFVFETVYSYNYDRLSSYVTSGTYPHVSHIKRGSMDIKNNIVLQIGDVVFRNPIDGDYVGLCRYPSLLPSNLTGFIIKIINGINGIALSSLICILNGADFDGDTVVGFVCSSQKANTELKFLSSATRWFISYQTSLPVIGLFQDSIIGIGELTRGDKTINRYYALKMLSKLNINYISGYYKTTLSNKNEHIKIKDLISIVLEQFPVSYKGISKTFNDYHSKYIKYVQDDINVLIENGKFVSGILDKSSVGQKVKNGIFHNIALYYGTRNALSIIQQLRRLVFEFIKMWGNSLSFSDVYVPPKIQTEIDLKLSAKLTEVKLLEDKLNNGEITASPDKTVNDIFEEQQVNLLDVESEFDDITYGKFDIEKNNIYKMITYGAKGDYSHMKKIATSIGQTFIDSSRPPDHLLGYRRTSPYYRMCETSPESKGFIANSYFSGMNVRESLFANQESRNQMTRKALSTSESGEAERIGVKNQEYVIVDNKRRSNKGDGIVQFLYGGDGIDPRKVEEINIQTIEMSNDKLKETFSIIEDGKVINEKEVNIIKEDRDFYRKKFIIIEIYKPSFVLDGKVKLPVNIDKVIALMKKEYNGLNKLNNNDTKILKHNEYFDLCEAFIKRLPYVHFNRFYEAEKKPIDDYVMKSFTLFSIYFRSKMYSKRLIDEKISLSLLKMIFEHISFRYKMSLIDYGMAIGVLAAQCLSEPQSQKVLDSVSGKKTGGTGGGIDDVHKFNEILAFKEQKDMRDARMFIYFKEEYEENESFINQFANNIEMIELNYFIVERILLYESINDIAKGEYAEDKEFVDTYTRLIPQYQPKSNITKYCIRLKFDKIKMMFKNVTIETIFNKFKQNYQNCHIIYNINDNDNIYYIIRIWVSNDLPLSNKETHYDDKLKYFIDNDLCKMILGVNKILATKVEDTKKIIIDEDGSIGSKKIFRIVTSGSNLAAILDFPEIDTIRTQTNVLPEYYKIYGSTKTAYKILNEMRALLLGFNIDYRHYTIYTNLMSYYGRILLINRQSLTKKEHDKILLRASQISPTEALIDGAFRGVYQPVGGVSDAIILGTMPNIGTNMNSIGLDISKFMNMDQNENNILDQL